VNKFPALRFPGTEASTKTIDVQTEKKLASSRRHWCHQIGPDSLIQKTQIITLKNGTVQPGDAFDDTALKTRFEIVKF
jgi:hypothetical protein